MNLKAKLTLSPYVKKVKSGFGEYLMVDEYNAIKAMEQHAKERSVEFAQWIGENYDWMYNDETGFGWGLDGITTEQLYQKFELERAQIAQK